VRGGVRRVGPVPVQHVGQALLDPHHPAVRSHRLVGVDQRVRNRGVLAREVHDLQDLDAINLGTLVAACHLGDDHQVAVFLDHCSPAIAERLAAAGVPRHRLRRTGFPTRTGPASFE
jgi:hypothetical protein